MALVTLLLRRASILFVSSRVVSGSSISQVPAQWKIIGCAAVVGNIVRPNKFSTHIYEVLIERMK
jgi:hypothetical protein